MYSRDLPQRMSPEPMSYNGTEGGLENSFTQRNQPAIRSSEVVTPSFLFGNREKRRSVLTAPNQRTPGRIPPPASKTVTWSPAVTHATASPRASTIYESDAEMPATTASPAPFRPPRVVPGGPPLRSLGDDELLGRSQIHEASSMESLADDDKEPMAFEKEDEMQDDTENEHEFWVKVIGHKADETDEIIKFFGRHGSLVSYKIPEDGNWIWIRYSSPLHANQALGRNGRFYRPNTLLAVFPCTEKDAPYSSSGNAASQSQPLSTSHMATRYCDVFERSERPTLEDSTLPTSSLETSSLNTTSQRPGIRSLSTNYRTSVNSSVNAKAFPQKSANDSLFDKVWNFIAP
uniref:Nucleoporin NUP35 n=1 Tax=Steinernema glaseri TaxID=37863 RepID=A0A1I8A018_9BILA